MKTLHRAIPIDYYFVTVTAGRELRSYGEAVSGQQAVETAQGRAVGSAVQGGICVVQ
jgi:hypothetical protein